MYIKNFVNTLLQLNSINTSNGTVLQKNTDSDSRRCLFYLLEEHLSINVFNIYGPEYTPVQTILRAYIALGQTIPHQPILYPLYSVA